MCHLKCFHVFFELRRKCVIEMELEAGWKVVRWKSVGRGPSQRISRSDGVSTGCGSAAVWWMNCECNPQKGEGLPKSYRFEQFQKLQELQSFHYREGDMVLLGTLFGANIWDWERSMRMAGCTSASKASTLRWTWCRGWDGSAATRFAFGFSDLFQVTNVSPWFTMLYYGLRGFTMLRNSLIFAVLCHDGFIWEEPH